MLVVDEAHYLRNRESQAWQAVNALPRQFLLLLTATPVQNSLEELYNLVTLLQPGQLPVAQGIPRPLPRSQTPAPAARAGGTAPAARPGHDPQHPRQRRLRTCRRAGPRRCCSSRTRPSARSGSNGRPNCAPSWRSSTPARPASGAGCCCRPPAAARPPGAPRWKNFPTAPPRAPGASSRRWKQAGGANAN